MNDGRVNLETADIERAFAALAEVEPLEIKTSRELTVAVMGAGSRGNE